MGVLQYGVPKIPSFNKLTIFIIYTNAFIELTNLMPLQSKLFGEKQRLNWANGHKSHRLIVLALDSEVAIFLCSIVYSTNTVFQHFSYYMYMSMM